MNHRSSYPQTWQRKDSTALQSYLRQLKEDQRPFLTREEEVELGRRIQVSGCRESRDELVVRNLRLVISVAKKTAGMDFEDRIQWGNVGLIKAATKFNPEKGFRFTTYATWWVKAFIYRAIDLESNTIRIPVYMLNKVREYLRIEAELRQNLGRTPLPEEIEGYLFESTTGEDKLRRLQAVIEAKTVSGECVSLDEWIGHDDESALGDFIAVDENGNHDRVMELKLLRDYVRFAISRAKYLTDIQREIIILRFGLRDGDPLTYELIGKSLGFSKQYAEQQVRAGIYRLKPVFMNCGLGRYA